MTPATMLQIKGQAPQVVNVADVSGIVNQVVSTFGALFPKVLALAYFLVVLVILYRLWQARVTKMSTMELIGLAIALALMR